MSQLTFVLFLIGGGLLVLGADLLVRGSSQLAVSLGVSPLVVGLTVVAVGTSAPEIAVTVQASGAGQSDLALGNVVGSNISNRLLILGLAAVISPLVVAQQLIRRDVPLLIGVSLLVVVLALDGALGAVDGALLLGGAVAYTAFAVWQSRRESAAVEAEYIEEFGVRQRPSVRQWLGQGGSVLVGLALLMLGARWLVDGAVALAQVLGVSDLVIGLTVVAAGTSLPEIASSVLAGLRGERDIAVGNVIGSCLFNLLAVLGLGGIVAPGGIAVPASALAFDLPVMVAATVACLPIFLHGGAILRWEGGLFLGYYGAYTLYLLLAASENALLHPFRVAMLVFVLPLTAVTLVVLFVRGLHRPNRRLGEEQ